MPIKIREYVDGKFFEWVTSLMLLGLAVEIIVWPDTLKSSAFRYFLYSFQSGSEGTGVVMIAVAVARIAALIVNGRSTLLGPRVRAYGCLAGVVMWSQIDLSLFMLLGERNNIPAPGIPIYFFLTVGEIYAAYRAATDVRTDRSVQVPVGFPDSSAGTDSRRDNLGTTSDSRGGARGETGDLFAAVPAAVDDRHSRHHAGSTQS